MKRKTGGLRYPPSSSPEAGGEFGRVDGGQDVPRTREAAAGGVDCVLVNGVSKTQMSPTTQGVCDALNCLWTIRIGRDQFGELLEIHQRALQIVLPFP